MCIHKFVDGFGLMGDAVVCVKCGYSKYPDVLSVFDSVVSTTIKNDGTYMSRQEFPFVVKFPTQVSFETKISEFTHYFNSKGVLSPVEEQPWE